MRQPLNLALLSEIAAGVIGTPGLALRAEQSAAGVPGWDSLSHTLIVLELGDRLGLELSTAETAACPTFGALVAHVNRAAGRG